MASSIILILFAMASKVHSFLVLYPISNNTQHFEKYKLMDLKNVVLNGPGLTTNGEIVLLNGERVGGVANPSNYYFLWPAPTSQAVKDIDYEELNLEEDVLLTTQVNTKIAILNTTPENPQVHNPQSETTVTPTSVYLAFAKTTIHTVNYVKLKTGTDGENCKRCGFEEIGPYFGAILLIMAIAALSLFIFFKKRRKIAFGRMFLNNKSVQIVHATQDVGTQCREIWVHKDPNYSCEPVAAVLSHQLVEVSMDQSINQSLAEGNTTPTVSNFSEGSKTNQGTLL